MSSVIACVVFGLMTRIRITILLSKPRAKQPGGEQEAGQQWDADRHDRQVDRPQPDLSKERSGLARLLWQVQPPQLHGHGYVLAASNCAKAQRHGAGHDARKELERVEGRKCVR